MKYLTRFADKNTALEFTTGGRVLKAPHVSKVGNDAVFSENIERGKSCIFVEESDGELKLVEPAEPWVTFTAKEDNSSIGLKKLSSNQTLEYSVDTTTWNTFKTTTNISLNNGDKVYVRGILKADNNSYPNYTQFKMNGKIAASGNCNALWNYQDLNAPLKAYCGNRMFMDCTSLTTAPELPATTLAKGCYYNMFWKCTSLTTVPELPATELAEWCYYYMFCDCTKLIYIKCLATDISANNCTDEWVSGVSSTGTFVKHPNMTSWTTGVSGIPADWTVEDAEL